MKPPAGIKFTTFLMAVAVLFHLVAALASPLPLRWNESHGMFVFIATVLGAAVVGLIIVFFECLVLWFYWHGRNWSRWIVVLGCLLTFVSIRHFTVGPPVSHGRTLIIFYRMAVAIVVLGYLCTPGARAWFARRSSKRLLRAL
jgi:hypothetical protein